MFVPKTQRSLGQKHFDSAVRPTLQELFRRFSRQTRKHLSTTFVSNRAAIVWIDEREIPGFVSLINVRHSRRSQLEQSLSERIDRTESRSFLRDWKKSRQKLVLRSRVQNFGDEIARRSKP